MTDLEIAAARALCDAADTFDIEERAVDMPFAPDHQEAYAWWYVRATDGSKPAAFAHEEGAIFYAAARTGWPAALAEIERLRAAVETNQLVIDHDRLVRELSVERDHNTRIATQLVDALASLRSLRSADDIDHRGVLVEELREKLADAMLVVDTALAQDVAFRASCAAFGLPDYGKRIDEYNIQRAAFDAAVDAFRAKAVR